jgi:hypothetical protein
MHTQPIIVRHRATPLAHAAGKKVDTYTSSARGLARLRSFALSIAAPRTRSGAVKVTLSQ